MKYEMKISLPIYKIVYAGFFVMLLSLIRGVTESYEIGIAMEAPMAMLAAVFCADTYTQEMSSKRSEIQRLYPMKKRMLSIYSRMLIQEIFLLALALMGYGLFFVFQNPRMLVGQSSLGSEKTLFLSYIFAIVITLVFWGIVSNLFSCLFQNMWMGIGGCLILWLLTNSNAGDRYLGAWNLFSYAFRDVEHSSDFRWIYGKIICLCGVIIVVAILPGVIKKRG